MEKSSNPSLVSHLPSRLKTLSKMCLTALALASVFSYAKMAHQRGKENTQQEIAQLFDAHADADATPDTIPMLQVALQKHPFLGIQSKLYFDTRVWQLHNALGRPKVDHYSNSKLRTLLPFVSINHYDALGHTCYIPDTTITQWLTEIPHAYQHQQVGIVNLTLDLCVGSVRSRLHGSFYNKTYQLPNSLEHHAHYSLEPEFLSAIFSHQYGVTLIEDLHMIPNEEQGKHFLTYLDGLTIYGATDIQRILKTDAGKLLLDWMGTHDGWYKIVDAITQSSLSNKKYRSNFLFTHLMLHTVQRNEIALICYNDPLYFALRKNDVTTSFQHNCLLSVSTAWTMFATQIQEALIHCHQHPLLQSQLYDFFFEHACTYGNDGIPAPSIQIFPFTLKNVSYKEQLEELYLKANAERTGDESRGKFTFTQFTSFPKRTSQ